MQNNRKLYIEILGSAYNTSGFIGRTLQRYVFEEYLKLLGEKDESIQKMKQKYRGTTKNQFDESIDFEGMQEEYENKVSSLDSFLFNLDLKNFEELTLHKDQYSPVKAAYDFYQFKTGHKKKAPAKIYRLNPSIFNRLHDIIKQLGRDSIELQILSEVKNQVTLADIYQPIDEDTDIVIVDKVADACWDLYQADNEIERNDLYENVLNGYHIEKYDDLPPDEYEKTVLKTAKQWVRDNEENLQIK